LDKYIVIYKMHGTYHIRHDSTVLCTVRTEIQGSRLGETSDKRDFRLLPWSRWETRSSGLLPSAKW